MRPGADARLNNLAAEPGERPNRVAHDFSLGEEVAKRSNLVVDLDDLVVERRVLEMMLNARHARKIQVINGLKPGNITRALRGEHVGTIIYAGG